MEINRKEILQEMTRRITRDNEKNFIRTDRLDYIRSVLEDSEYEIFRETDLSITYKKKNVELSQKIVLISSHVDCVDEIQNPNFKITKKGNYKGTFDNAATNAVVVISMLEKQFSDHVLVAFTGDEEINSNGAKQVMEVLEKENKKVIAIALDVTYDIEGEYDKNISTYDYASYTIDNLCCNTKRKYAKSLFGVAKELNIPFMVTRAEDGDDYFEDKEDRISDYYDEQFEVDSIAYADEAIIYSQSKFCEGAFSLCLPTNEQDNMHTDKLIKIKEKSFNQYLEAVVQIANRVLGEN